MAVVFPEPADADSTNPDAGREMQNRLRTTTIRVLAVIVIVCVLAAGAIAWQIRREVRDNRRLAQQAHPHPGNDVAALIEFMNSPEHSFHDRNHKAVWTLGRLRAPEALPALQAAYTGAPCDHDRALCQAELEKAIRRCGGSPPAPSNGEVAP